MRFAVLTADQTMVDNVIVAREEQKQELEAVLGRVLMDASPLGMQIGDLYNGTAWTRNVDGEQVALPIGDSADGAEALAILSGEVTDGAE